MLTTLWSPRSAIVVQVERAGHKEADDALAASNQRLQQAINDSQVPPFTSLLQHLMHADGQGIVLTLLMPKSPLVIAWKDQYHGMHHHVVLVWMFRNIPSVCLLVHLCVCVSPIHATDLSQPRVPHC